MIYFNKAYIVSFNMIFMVDNHSNLVDRRAIYAVKFNSEDDFERGGRFILENTEGPGLPNYLFCVEGWVLEDLRKMGINYSSFCLEGEGRRNSLQEALKYFDSLKS